MTGPDDVRRAMGWQQRHPALEVRCPHCNAAPGSRCTTRTGKRLAKAPHLARVEAHDPPPAAPIRHQPFC